ncbi:hypothetical protein chiPu_0003381 [Chiloscyllium punctatum]|uniref:SHSP domain-containing protein n=1 Tax=Chiloscyllium punctatum TaxID=137246 RepID=A0A401S3N5_CHIPU|nr:hypothetical protein [Chiloscyllium punctatum]
MPKKRSQKGHTSFAHPPNKYTVAVNLLDAEGPHKVNATVRDTRVNVYGQRVDEIKTKDGEIRYNFHGFSNEFELPENVDPDSLTLSMADNQTILIEGNRRSPRRGSQSKQRTEPRKTRSQYRTQAPSQTALGNETENQGQPAPWKGRKDEDIQATKPQTSDDPCRTDSNWVRLKYSSPPRTPCCPLCCGPV